MSTASSTKGVVDRGFQNALSALQARRLGDAARLFDAVLRAEPKHIAALNLMGVVLVQLGRFTEAESYLRRALQHAPPSDATLYNYGIVLKVLNRPLEALQRFSEALRLNPSAAETWNCRGATLSDLNRHDEAIANFDKATTLDPRHADAFQNKGKSLLTLQRGDEALAAFDRALAINSGLTEAWLGRGHVLAGSQRYGDALSAYDRAIALKPNLAELWFVRGLVLSVLGNHQAALSDLDRALAIDPNRAEASVGRGNIFLQLQKYDDALAAYDRALTLNANIAEAWFGRADVFLHLRAYEKALAAFDRALALRPDIEFAKGARLHMKLSLSNWTNLEAEISDLVATVRAGKPAIAPFLFIGMSSSTADLLTCPKSGLPDRPPFPFAERGKTYSHDRIRVGYFSADFRTHPVAQLMAGVFEHHDKSRFEITAVSYGLDDASDVPNRIKSAAENFIDVCGMTDDEIAEIVLRREIDVIIDLTGLTFYTRSSVLSRRLAPIQVNFLGYSGTMGADWFDYIIADPTIIPEDHFGFYSEQPVWLPDTYQPNAYKADDSNRHISERPPTRVEYNLPEAGFVFCSFNNTYKITPAMFDVWMRLLKAIPDSVLWLSQSNSTAEANLRKEAELRGVSPERIIFAPRLLEMSDHLARQRHANLFLDTLPYNAHTTASDALWAGLPVLTCLGETFAGRVAASLLKAIGLPELIATSLENYEALALKLARDPSLLASIRAKLARNRGTHPLFDTARFTRHIEAAYTTMWQRYQNGEPPRAFAVESIS
jgi:protein O-GlcNAc transferase